MPVLTRVPAAVRIFSGEQNQGIFVKLLENARGGPAGEEYQITHPTASVNGLLRGSLWVAICDTTSITCRGGRREGEEAEGQGPRLRTLVEYKDEVRASVTRLAVAVS
jgi:hypothetical protein